MKLRLLKTVIGEEGKILKEGEIVNLDEKSSLFKLLLGSRRATTDLGDKKGPPKK